ncbi:MFS transporter [Muricoccus radiodurans]|uniref:MFS transporter n=1 Tax=Muricoccus radiodurans TaxID=2231721 RepID=UPI003CED7E3A
MSCLGMSLSILLWAVSGLPVLAPFALLFGVFQGGFVALTSAVVVDLFGARAASGANGLLLTARGIGMLVGIPAITGAATVLGDALPLVAVALLGLAGCALLMVLATGRDRGARAASPGHLPGYSVPLEPPNQKRILGWSGIPHSPPDREGVPAHDHLSTRDAPRRSRGRGAPALSVPTLFDAPARQPKRSFDCVAHEQSGDCDVSRCVRTGAMVTQRGSPDPAD